MQGLELLQKLPVGEWFCSFCLIGVFKIDKVTPQANGESSKVKVKVRTNIHGIFTVSSASMVEKGDDHQEEGGEENMETDDGPKPENSDNSLPSEEDSAAESKSAESNEVRLHALLTF